MELIVGVHPLPQRFSDWLESLMGEIGETISGSLLWTYQQATGKILDPSGLEVGRGYSGKGKYKNDPEAQDIKDMGPIPEGYYTIGLPHDTVTHGPFVIPLTPRKENQMFGRDGFLIHGDSIVTPGTASQGCIIANRHIREDIAKSPVKVLSVVSGIFMIKKDLEETQV